MILGRAKSSGPVVVGYRLTAAGQDLPSIMMGLGSGRNPPPVTRRCWWYIRRNINPIPMPPKCFVIQFLYPTPAGKRCSLVIDRGTVDLCLIDPSFEVDLYVVADLRAITVIA